MNPNSQNQLWSKWVFTVTPGDRRRADLPFAEMKKNCARFGRDMFKSSSEMKIDRSQDDKGTFWTVSVITEGHPVHDPEYVTRMAATWAKFFRAGFGAGTHTHCDAKLLAGDAQNGAPRDQLIILPPLRLWDEDEDSRNVISRTH